MEGNPDDPRDFGHPTMQQARVATAYKIAWFLKKMGKDTSWWDNVVIGKQNPFEKMIFPKDVKGAGQLQALDNKKKISDDEKITL